MDLLEKAVAFLPSQTVLDAGSDLLFVQESIVSPLQAISNILNSTSTQVRKNPASSKVIQCRYWMRTGYASPWCCLSTEWHQMCFVVFKSTRSTVETRGEWGGKGREEGEHDTVRCPVFGSSILNSIGVHCWTFFYQNVDLAIRMLNLADYVGGALLKTKRVGEEATVVKTKQMTMSLESQSPDEVTEKKFGQKSAVLLPTAEELLRGQANSLPSIGVQVIIR